MGFAVLRRPCVALLVPDSGNNGNPAKPGRLIIPGQRPSHSPVSNTPPPAPMTDAVDGDGKRTYHPPMGYFLKGASATEAVGMDIEVMLQRLQSGAGRWHALAAYLPQLNSSGYDAVLIENLTGIPKGEQSILVIAASVLRSISVYCEEQRVPDVDDMLSFFDIEGTHFALYELRFLDVGERVTCAKYVAQQELNAEESKDLARSTKEYLRRGGEETGFQPTPEDVLAYKFYRNALESREQELISSFVQKGLKLAQSENARKKLEDIVSEHETIVEDPVRQVAKISITRLLSSETLIRTLPYAGDLYQVEASALRRCPKIRSVGEYGLFTMDMESTDPNYPWSWLTLPNWQIFARAKQPVALSLKNCADVPELRSSILVKTKEEAVRLSGTGMLVADVADKDTTDSASYFLIEDDTHLKLTQSDDIHDAEVLGKVLCVCRPPDKNSEF